jgi:glycosyltransferase involved in cell wall biosynthesis
MNLDNLNHIRLRVGIVCGPLHPVYGGPASVVLMHYKALKDSVDITIFGVVSDEERNSVEELYPGVRLARRSWPSAWFRGDSLYSLLMTHANDIDIFHVHMLWDHPVYATWKVCQQLKKPFVLTPHGTLSEPWRYSSLHKRIYKYLFADRIMRSAFAVQALNKKEETAINNACSNVRVLVIPNGIDLQEVQSVISNEEIEGGLPQINVSDKRLFLYLGRLWRDKGLDILPSAWKLAFSGRNDAILLIVGPDYNNYKKELERQLFNMNLMSSVKILPPVQGLSKITLLQSASAFILPSKSEGFSMSLLEAAGSGTPCIFSYECNFPELASSGGGFEIPRTVNDLAQALLQVMEMSPDELQEIGLSAKKIVTEQYSLSIVRKNLFDCYNSAIKG